MNDLTDGIIQFSRIGTRTESAAPLDLRELVLSLTSDFNLSPDQIDLDSSVDRIEADPVGLRRVVENLVGNSVKYHHAIEDLNVQITCEETSDGYTFSVADNGPGIDPKHQEKIFDMFQTLRTADAPESTGIGLAIVKKVVEGHGGSVTLDSSVGNGTRFSFPWPKESIGSSDLDAGLAA